MLIIGRTVPLIDRLGPGGLNFLSSGFSWLTKKKDHPLFLTRRGQAQVMHPLQARPRPAGGYSFIHDNIEGLSHT